MDISRLGDQNKHIEQHRFQSDLNPVDKSNVASSTDAPDSVQFTPSRNDSIELSKGAFNKEIDFAQKVYSKLNTQGTEHVKQARANVQNGVYDLNNPKIADKVVKGLTGDLTGQSAAGTGKTNSGEEANEPAIGQSRLEEIREKVKNNQDVLNTVAQRLYKSISKI